MQVKVKKRNLFCSTVG